MNELLELNLGTTTFSGPRSVPTCLVPGHRQKAFAGGSAPATTAVLVDGGGMLLLSTEEDSALFEKLDSLALLPNNWDSYGAPPPSKESVRTAKRFLANLLLQSRASGLNIETPAIQAGGSGTVGFAWGGEKSVEVEAHPDGVLTFVRAVGEHVDVGTVETPVEVLGMLIE